jgi:hypothetical protein
MDSIAIAPDATPDYAHTGFQWSLQDISGQLPYCD